MATGIYITVKGEKTTDVKGSCQVEGHKDKIEAYNISHGVSGPGFDKPGRVGGPRQHAPMSFSAPTDKATPILHKMLVTNELIKEAIVELTTTDASGKDDVYLTITLNNAAIDGISSAYSSNSGSNDDYSFSLSYEKIKWAWKEGNVNAVDDLLNPNASS